MIAAITSVRHAAEWGMECVPKCYRCLKLPLSYGPDKRARLPWNIYQLHNLRVRTTGISQILTVIALIRTVQAGDSIKQVIHVFI